MEWREDLMILDFYSHGLMQKMSVMGGEQAARTMAQVALEGAERKGQDPKKYMERTLKCLKV